jgi:hypothetical protein
MHRRRATLKSCARLGRGAPRANEGADWRARDPFGFRNRLLPSARSLLEPGLEHAEAVPQLCHISPAPLLRLARGHGRAGSARLGLSTTPTPTGFLSLSLSLSDRTLRDVGLSSNSAERLSPRSGGRGHPSGFGLSPLRILCGAAPRQAPCCGAGRVSPQLRAPFRDELVDALPRPPVVNNPRGDLGRGGLGGRSVCSQWDVCKGRRFCCCGPRVEFVRRLLQR